MANFPFRDGPRGLGLMRVAFRSLLLLINNIQKPDWLGHPGYIGRRIAQLLKWVSCKRFQIAPVRFWPSQLSPELLSQCIRSTDVCNLPNVYSLIIDCWVRSRWSVTGCSNCIIQADPHLITACRVLYPFHSNPSVNSKKQSGELILILRWVMGHAAIDWTIGVASVEPLSAGLPLYANMIADRFLFAHIRNCGKSVTWRDCDPRRGSTNFKDSPPKRSGDVVEGKCHIVIHIGPVRPGLARC